MTSGGGSGGGGEELCSFLFCPPREPLYIPEHGQADVFFLSRLLAIPNNRQPLLMTDLHKDRDQYENGGTREGVIYRGG